MTTKPKAKRFRIKRSGTSGVAATSAASTGAPSNSGQTPPVPRAVPSPAPSAAAQPKAAAGQPPRAATAGPTAAPAQGMTGQVSSARETASDTDIEAIRREGLTGRQLRMARRVAQRHGLPATSDFDAVRLLRQKGIDPFQRANMLELVVPKKDDAQVPAKTEGDQTQLPQTVPVHPTYVPSTDFSPARAREDEISKIQRDLAKRRRRRMGLLLARLSFFVFLPTVIAGYYFFSVATPMYSTKSEFLILQADGGAAGGMGGLLSGTQFATNQDSIAVQSYLQSKDAMLRLNDDAGFKAHFTQDEIDPIQRLSPDPTNEEAYKTFKKNVKIGYDPTEGVIRMEVIAADPLIATAFSRKLISYAEERVNSLSEQKRSDQMREALISFEEAQAERRTAQQQLVDLQVQGSILDPEAVIASIRTQINNLEVQLQEKRLQLAALMDNARPNQSRVDGTQGDIRRLETLLAELNARMTDVSQGENSLAQLAVRIQMAQADLVTRDMLLQSALQAVESTRTEANRQVRYLTISVEPVSSEEPSYPRAFENTLLAFMVFGGIYLLVSLTASILREQVSS
ncbi:capsule biosynthesis protein [Aestuariivita sp.]|jgi:capsular polysaccharide transport system permease protein|uniref:capsule biosynthesis protein n=1 Tax=Aestuariivita sp. TaxID=1872407 RepID=UPI00216BCAB5|nr:capsule biosynthesis protein [Aestuariivita sp.]MCE8006238.1 capsule biosynthesis protein [Aestuariivita sp.]